MPARWFARPEFLLLDEPTVGVDPLSRRELWEIILQLVDDQKLTVLLSTSYLDEAERCGHVVVMHHGKVLAQGRPSDSQRAGGRPRVSRRPPPAEKAREFQARLLDRPDIVDAVPEGGQVRFVRSDNAQIDYGWTRKRRSRYFAGASITAAAPRFEDGFMVLLQRTGAPREIRRRDDATSYA